MLVKRAAHVLFLISSLYHIVYALTCLSCDSITQPRHCRTVARCSAGEVCGIEKLHTLDGSHYQAYRLGCLSSLNCDNHISVNGTSCQQCCSTHLCNAGLCGEPGYPAKRGPICYDCPFHTDRQPCRHIEFCSSDEECSVVGVEEFGEVALRSGCRQKYSCPAPALPPASFVGKRSLSERSAGSAICDACCSKDLCNLNCSAQNQCSFMTCRHGSCVAVNSSTAICQCLPGWRGTRCDQVDHCTPSPCFQGTCLSTSASYSCSCFLSWRGIHCETSDLDCDFESGTCTWTQSQTDNVDWYRQSGSTPSSSTGPRGDHTTGTGYYMYIEASSGSTGYKADLVSKLLSPKHVLCMELWYNMYGLNMGSIDVYIKPESGTMFIIQHLKQKLNTQTWQVRNITIPAQKHNYHIVIEGLRGSGVEGDAAIDDIKLYSGPCV